MLSFRIARWLCTFAVALIAFSLLLFSSPTEEKHISIYSTVANYSLPVSERNERDYIGLLEVLDPLGSVKASTSGSHWRLRYDRTEAEFSAGSNQALIRGHS